MKKFFSRFSIGLAMLCTIFLVISAPVMSVPNQVTIVGEINDEYQILARDGNIYYIGDTEMGNELLTYIGMVAEVTGTVEEEEDVKIIYVAGYKILDE
ncbi:hypothetical protein ACFL03_01930 [Thermodesulfobacteriota bacterium]